MKKKYMRTVLTSLVLLFANINLAQTEAENLLNLLLSTTKCAPGPEMMELEEELREEPFFFDEPLTVSAALTADPVLYARALAELENYITTEKRRTGTFSYGDRYILYPLSRAAERGHTATMEVLLSCGTDVNRPDEYKSYWTPLHTAARYRKPEAVRTLVRHGADVNRAAIDDKRVPLHYAAWNGDLGSIQALVYNGAQIDAQDKKKNTPLHFAAANGKLTAVRFLLSRRTRLQENSEKQTPLGIAIAAYTATQDAAQKQRIKDVIHHLISIGFTAEDKQKLDATFPGKWRKWEV